MDDCFEIIMKRAAKENVGIQLLLKKYRDIFRIPENLRYYPETNYKIAEKKFIKYALLAEIKTHASYLP
jgi:hypothetical protein